MNPPPFSRPKEHFKVVFFLFYGIFTNHLDWLRTTSCNSEKSRWFFFHQFLFWLFLTIIVKIDKDTCIWIYVPIYTPIDYFLNTYTITYMWLHIFFYIYIHKSKLIEIQQSQAFFRTPFQISFWQLMYYINRNQLSPFYMGFYKDIYPFYTLKSFYLSKLHFLKSKNLLEIILFFL